MDLVVVIAIGSLVVTLMGVTVAGYFGYRNKRDTDKQSEFGRRAYVDSLPCQLNAATRIVAVDQSPTGGISLQIEIQNEGLGRAFNIVCETRSTFLWDFDRQRTVRKAQPLNLMRRDPSARRSKGAYAPFGFDERLDIPPHVRDTKLRYLDPNQRHIVPHLFFVPWQYLGHPSGRALTPLDKCPPPELWEGMEALEEVFESGFSEDKVNTFLEIRKARGAIVPEVKSSETKYERDESLPPGMLLYGENDSQHGRKGRAFLYGPGNGLQLNLRFSHCAGGETKHFALPSPLLVFHPDLDREIQLVETDAKGVELNEERTISIY